MSSYDDQVRKDARLAFQQQQQANREAAVETAASLARESARLRALADNPEWKWFLETHLIPFVVREHDSALDTSRTALERNDSAQRHAAAKEAVEMLGKKVESAMEATRRAHAEIPAE